VILREEDDAAVCEVDHALMKPMGATYSTATRSHTHTERERERERERDLHCLSFKSYDSYHLLRNENEICHENRRMYVVFVLDL